MVSKAFERSIRVRPVSLSRVMFFVIDWWHQGLVGCFCIQFAIRMWGGWVLAWVCCLIRFPIFCRSCLGAGCVCSFLACSFLLLYMYVIIPCFHACGVQHISAHSFMVCTAKVVSQSMFSFHISPLVLSDPTAFLLLSAFISLCTSMWLNASVRLLATHLSSCELKYFWSCESSLFCSHSCGAIYVMLSSMNSQFCSFISVSPLYLFASVWWKCFLFQRPLRFAHLGCVLLVLLAHSGSQCVFGCCFVDLLVGLFVAIPPSCFCFLRFPGYLRSGFRFRESPFSWSVGYFFSSFSVFMCLASFLTCLVKYFLLLCSVSCFALSFPKHACSYTVGFRLFDLVYVFGFCYSFALLVFWCVHFPHLSYFGMRSDPLVRVMWFFVFAAWWILAFVCLVVFLRRRSSFSMSCLSVVVFVGCGCVVALDSAFSISMVLICVFLV